MPFVVESAATIALAPPSTAQLGGLAQVTLLLHDHSDSLVSLTVIALALLAGLVAACGREIQMGRKLGRSWWIARLLLLPLLLIAAIALKARIDLSDSTIALTAALLSLGGYDALGQLEALWRSRLADADLTEVSARRLSKRRTRA